MTIIKTMYMLDYKLYICWTRCEHEDSKLTKDYILFFQYYKPAGPGHVIFCAFGWKEKLEGRRAWRSQQLI